jgi:hypothetical protein
MSNFHQLRNRLRGDEAEPWYIIRRGQKLRALCLRRDLNPRASFGSVEVWIEDGQADTEWAQRLADEKTALPVYVADDQISDYRCLGLFYVQPRHHTLAELEAAQKESGRCLCRIIFLERAQVTEMIFR